MKEQYIVTVDGLYDDFEIVDWCKTKNEAEVKFAEYSLEGEYPDKEGRHLRLFQEIKSTDTSEKEREE